MSSFFRTNVSYDERRKIHQKQVRLFGLFILLIILYFITTLFFIESWNMRTEGMSPNFPTGTRIIMCSRFILPRDWTPERGQVLILRPPYLPPLSHPKKIFDPILRLFTLGYVSLSGGFAASFENHRIMKRIIALPGDWIKIDNSVAYIKTNSYSEFASEFEIIDIPYTININKNVFKGNFNSVISGHMPKRKMGNNEYFVLGDNRAASNDSRYWGPLKAEDIQGVPMFIYWPVSHFGPY